MIYNVTRLSELLREAWEAAGLPVDGITVSIFADGTIQWSALATQQHMDIAVTVLANYTEVDPDETAKVANRARRIALASDLIANITAAQALAWQTNNITEPLAAAKTAIQAATTLAQLRAAFIDVVNVMEKMDRLQKGDVQLTIALRNKVWPELQGS